MNINSANTIKKESPMLFDLVRMHMHTNGLGGHNGNMAVTDQMCRTSMSAPAEHVVRHLGHFYAQNLTQLDKKELRRFAIAAKDPKRSKYDFDVLKAKADFEAYYMYASR